MEEERNPQLVRYSWQSLELLASEFKRKPFRLSFPKPLEDTFGEYYVRKYIGKFRTAIVLGVILYSLFGLIDWLTFPHLKEELWLFRFGIFLPVGIVSAVLSFLITKEKELQWAQTLSVVVGGLCIVGMMAVIGGKESVLYVTGLLLVVIYTNALSAIRFRYALLASFIILLSYFLTDLLYIKCGTETLILESAYLLTGNIISLTVNYFLERHTRIDFLNSLILSYEKKQFEKLSYIDPLTGVANRRKFEENLQREWFRLTRLNSPLSLLVIDIDFFKSFNDTLGHPEGDRALIKVAGAISASVRGSTDTIARYGGEEFVVLLPETDLEQAKRTAERIRTTVMGLRIRHPASEAGEFLSVSIGVASVFPSKDKSPKELIQVADQALYRAKEKGRNRVEIVKLSYDQS
ncbi:MAG: GGDEF domain-containing protein [Aquificae bacterium]|nr:GGDEF domain-containing protein [Aquificota bacterium]